MPTHHHGKVFSRTYFVSFATSARFVAHLEAGVTRPQVTELKTLVLPARQGFVTRHVTRGRFSITGVVGW